MGKPYGIQLSLSDNKILTISNYKQIREENLKEYGDDPDINAKRKWGIHTNGATFGNPKHSCLDWFLSLGHIEINYTDFNYNWRFRNEGHSN
jgi:hypothetical protein